MAYNQNNNQDRSDDSVTFDIQEHIGVIRVKDSGWNREVNLVCWNNGIPKIDIREWNPQHTRMSKGITLLEEDARQLAELLCRRYSITPPGSQYGCAGMSADTGQSFENASVAEADGGLPYEDGGIPLMDTTPQASCAASPA